MIAATIALGLVLVAAHPREPLTARVHTLDGRDIEGIVAPATWRFFLEEGARDVRLEDLLSLHSAAPASDFEAAQIRAGLDGLDAADVAAAEAAATSLADIGLPVLTPLLQSYQDVDAHQPDPRYRLFGRLIPARADARDRTLDLVRTADGDVFRARWQAVDLELKQADGGVTRIPGEDVRWIAIRRDQVTRAFELDALRDCTYVGFLDTGAVVTPASRLVADCAGYVRLSFDEDGWATDPDGILEPLPGKRKLQEGFRWGSVLGRVGTAGERFFVGKHLEQDGLGRGRLFFVVNDNEHWQNNIGGYRVQLTVSNAYDLAEPH